MAITLTHKSETPFWKDVSFLEKCKKTDFVALIYEMLSEKIPSDKQRRLFELILKLSIDHGQDTPSAIPVIDGAKAGENVSASIARGIKKNRRFARLSGRKRNDAVLQTEEGKSEC